MTPEERRLLIAIAQAISRARESGKGLVIEDSDRDAVRRALANIKE